MLKNYFKISWRNLKRNRSHALINLLGLAIGICCCLLILLWVNDELSYDLWNEKADRIYRVTPEIKFGGKHDTYAVAPAPLAEALVADFPEVESSVRFRDYGSAMVKRDVQNYNENRIISTDSSIFNVFSIKLIKGDPSKVLRSANSIMINESTAARYFPNEDPIGQKLTFDDRLDYVVEGVIEDIPANSHFNFDIFRSLQASNESRNGIWLSNNFHTYYVLKEEADPAAFQAKLEPHLLEKYLGPQIEQMFGQKMEDFDQNETFIKFHIQELKDIHLHSDLVVELGANGSIRYVWIFSLIALFILLIACINFMNLSTASSSVRAREIGIRKVLGSFRKDLIYQFLVESTLLAAMAFIIGIIIAQLALPYYNNLADKSLQIPFDQPIFWLVSFGGIILVGLLAGCYPAFYLSAFKPIKTLSGKLLEKGGNLSLRNSLVVLQFLIAILLIIGTVVINQQLNFIQATKLGYEREQVIILDNAEPLRDRAFSLKEELLNHPDIQSVTVSGYLPIPSYRSDSPICIGQEFKEDNCIAIQMWDVDEDYIPTFQMELVDGRNFSPDMPTDSNAIIINERAASLLGYDDPIDKIVYANRSFNPQEGMLPFRIIGIVKDFHFESLRENIGALSFWLNPGPGHLNLKVNTADMSGLIASMERSWKEMAPGLPFSYRFMDTAFDRVYRAEQRISKIFNIFSGLSIFIACLGLFGLTAFTTERRTKEIGIRKVLGATTQNLVSLLSKDFLKPVLVAILIAIPIGYYFMRQWLNDFAYRVDLKWWVFLLAGLIGIAIAFVTVSYQSIKAALANPVESLRNE